MDRYQLFETIERLTGKTLVESELDEICRLFDDKTPIEKENKRLAMQVEVLSAAFENSSEKEKELINEKAEMLQLINAMLAAEKESNGICDCIDNNGDSYQSAFLAGVLSQMEIIASKNKPAQS